MRTLTLGAALSTVMVVVVHSPAFAQPKAVEKKFALASLGKRGISHTPVRLLIEFMEEKCDVAIRVDEAAFKKSGIPVNLDHVAQLPAMPEVPLAFAVEILAQQVGGTAKSEGGGFVFVPGSRDLESLLSPAGADIKKKLSRDATIKSDIKAFEWQLVVEHFADQENLDVLVAEWSFPKAVFAPEAPRKAQASPDVRNALTFRYRLFNNLKCLPLAAGTRPLEKWLDQLAAQVNGKVVARDELILIVPKAAK